MVACLAAMIGAPPIYATYRWVDARRRASTLAARVPRLIMSPMTIVPGIHVLGGLQPSAAYVVETPEGLVLIDSGLEDNAGPLRSEMAKLGLDWRRVRAVFLTHAHGDHCGGAEYLRALARAKVYAGRDDAPVLRAGEPREAFFSTFYMPGRVPHPTSVDVTLSGDETFAFGDVRIRAIAAPGHTPGSVCYLVERDGLRVFFSGDVIMKLLGEEPPHYELDKPLGTYSAYLAPRYRGDAGEYLATLRRLRDLPSPDLLLPGHPSSDPSPQSPALLPGRWEALLDVGIRDMETLQARYKADGADFLDGEPKRLLPGLYYLGDHRSAAVYGFFASSRFFLVDAPGGPGLLDFAKDRLRRLGREPKAPDAVLLTGCDAAETAGLGELVEQCHAQVVAPASGLHRVKEICPPGTTILPAEDLPGRGWFPVTPIALRGRGSAPVAYHLPWEGKSVLFSGRIPTKINQETGIALFDDFRNGRGDLRGYLGSLDLLRGRKPDLWLPAAPTEGQNANLYDDQWDRVLDDLRLGIEQNRGALGVPGR